MPLTSTTRREPISESLRPRSPSARSDYGWPSSTARPRRARRPTRPLRAEPSIRGAAAAARPRAFLAFGGQDVAVSGVGIAPVEVGATGLIGDAKASRRQLPRHHPSWAAALAEKLGEVSQRLPGIPADTNDLTCINEVAVWSRSCQDRIRDEEVGSIPSASSGSLPPGAPQRAWRRRNGRREGSYAALADVDG